jgi:hypothetical protein
LKHPDDDNQWLFGIHLAHGGHAGLNGMDEQEIHWHLRWLMDDFGPEVGRNAGFGTWNQYLNY